MIWNMYHSTEVRQTEIGEICDAKKEKVNDFIIVFYYDTYYATGM